MNTTLHIHDADNRRLIRGCKQALDANYARRLETAKQEWERNFAGNDPSDACVSVRVTSGDAQKLPRPRAGILRQKSRRSLVNGHRHGLLT